MAALVQNAQEVSLKVMVDIGESLLAVAYLRMESEGLLPMMFWEKTPTLSAFLEWCSRPDCILAGCFTEVSSPTWDAPKIELAGLGWLHNIKTRNGFRYGDVGEVFWRETQSAGMSMEFGRLLLDFAFGPCHMRSIYGVTPERNIAAIRFMKHIGFESFGPIPNLCCWRGEECGGYMSCMTVEKWARRKAE